MGFRVTSLATRTHRAADAVSEAGSTTAIYR